MAFWRENKLGKLGKNALLEICSDLVRFELFVADCTAPTEQRIGEAKNLAIGVVLPLSWEAHNEHVRRSARAGAEVASLEDLRPTLQ